jgi:hypothetical protein
VEETVINNNYYDQPGGGQEHFEHGGERRGIDQNVSAPFNEGGGQSDQGGAQFSDANYETSGDDQGGFDNGGSGFDNSGTDDGGSGFDDGGGGDSGGGFDGGGGDFS